MQATASLPAKPGRYERAKQLGRLGYTVAESIFCPGLFEIRKPDGRTIYRIETMPRDNSGWHCDCPATVQDCSHVLFLERCLRHAALVEARKMITAARKRRTMGSRRVSALKKLAEKVQTEQTPVPAQPVAPKAAVVLPRYPLDMERDFC